MDSKVHTAFEQSAGAEAVFVHGYDTLYQNLDHILTGVSDLNTVERALRREFKTFLKSMGYEIALKNFECLLQEKSGDKFFRNDGSVNWYHEFIPIMHLLAVTRMGHENGGMDFKDLEQCGELETLISTGICHDSVEDFISMPEMIVRQRTIANLVKAENPGMDPARIDWKIDWLLKNINIITQRQLTDEQGKVLIGPRGKPLKEDSRTYIKRTSNSEDANPGVFMYKQTDIGHNVATLLCFVPERRLARLDKREDMYGKRHNYYETALKKWPEFAQAIELLDGLMGQGIYPHFRYLESVDLYYKTPSDDPVSSLFLPKSLSIKLPELIHCTHIVNKTFINSNPENDPEKQKRLDNFLDNVLYPSFAGYEDHFPYIFGQQKHQPRANPSLAAC